MASFLDSLLGWLLLIDSSLAILIISFILSLITSLAIKFLTNQTMMKSIRNEMKDLQSQMKTAKSNPKKLTKINSRLLEINMSYMSESWKPSLYTLLPMLIIFGWLGSHMGYYPLQPNQEFKVTAYFEDYAGGSIKLVPDENITVTDSIEKAVVSKEMTWNVFGKEGYHTLNFEYKNKTFKKEVIISNERVYAPVEQSYKTGFLFFSSANDAGLSKVTLPNREIMPFQNVPGLNMVPVINTLNWFWTYVIFSIAFSLVLRKVLDLY
jgi:uncharacterized membrane protein (DUF106 family)